MGMWLPVLWLDIAPNKRLLGLITLRKMIEIYFIAGIHLLNSLWSSDAIWRHRFGLTLAQVMACCLMVVPSHYLNQYWLIMSEVFWHSLEDNLTGSDQDIYPWYEIENNSLRAKFFRGNKNIYLHFMSFLHIDMTQVVGILPSVRQRFTYIT